MLALIIRQLYDVSGIEALLYMVMGYGLQHLGFTAASVLQVLIPMNVLWWFALRICVLAVLYIYVGTWLAQRFRIQIEAVKKSLRWVTLSIFVLVCAIVFNMVLVTQTLQNIIPLSVDVAFRMLDFLCTLLGMSVLLLVSTRDRLISDIDLLTQLNEAKMRHYHMSRENMELVNTKFHDVRKGLASVRAQIQNLNGTQQDFSHVSTDSMHDLENAIRVYDSIYQTGNDLIDAVLTEKSLYCSAHSITLSAIIDGQNFDFLEPSEIASLFGNILDNAIEAVENPRLDAHNRVIELNAHSNGGYAIIESSNFYADDVVISDETGLPVSQKTDKRFHGFGMKSIAAVVQEYEGTVRIHADNNAHIFEIRIVLPVPSHKEIA
ncbi:ATP-binding protein [Alloscardovia omnicolens]|uniref:ATP-binding protein n=1 Tax=Alloscardovia omnicolens TaxID=419015 RepID=UPI003A6E4151